IAIVSYDGHLHFGLLGDFDAMPDLDHFADLLAEGIEDLARAAAVDRPLAKPAPQRAAEPTAEPREPAAVGAEPGAEPSAGDQRPPLGFEMPRTRGRPRVRRPRTGGRG